MPRYKTEAGVVVDVPAEKAARIGGLTPVEPPPARALKAPRQPRTPQGG